MISVAWYHYCVCCHCCFFKFYISDRAVWCHDICAGNSHSLCKLFLINICHHYGCALTKMKTVSHRQFKEPVCAWPQGMVDETWNWETEAGICLGLPETSRVYLGKLSWRNNFKHTDHRMWNQWQMTVFIMLTNTGKRSHLKWRIARFHRNQSPV